MFENSLARNVKEWLTLSHQEHKEIRIFAFLAFWHETFSDILA